VIEPFLLDRGLRLETPARAVSLTGSIDRESGELSSLPTGSSLI